MTPENNPVPNQSVNPQQQPRKTTWQAVKFAVKAIEIRLRFIAILVGIGLLIGYWDTLRNYWDKWTRPSAAAVAASADEEFYCPMHPKVVRPTLEPDGSVPKCPICGMKLSTRKIGAPPELPADVISRVQLSPERIELAGIKTAEVQYEPLNKTIRAVGYVEYDESKLSQAVTRVNGYIEKLYVDKSWQDVMAGEALADLYSPELYSTSQELLVAQKRGLKEMMASSRERLRLLGISDQEMDKIETSGEPAARIVIRSPLSGHVIAKHVVEGARVEEGMTLFELADLSTVWIEADVFEKDAHFLKAGQEIVATVDAYPDQEFVGKVSLVHPHVERETRTNRVRFVLSNPGHPRHLLRPGMYATVQISVPLAEIEPFASQIAEREHRPNGDDVAQLEKWQKNCPVTGLKLGSMGKPVEVTVEDKKVLLCCSGCVEKIKATPDVYLAHLAPPPADYVLAVPERAVIDTGSKKVVYVEREPGQFDGIEVKLGPRSGEMYPVIDGLAPGDRIAAAGAFLIDAETRLNPAAASAFFGASGGAHEGHAPASTTMRRNGDGKNQSAGKIVLTEEQLSEIAKLPASDQQAARDQISCPITGEPLGSMGVPFKIIVDGKPLFLCCEGCQEDVKKNPQAALKNSQASENRQAK